VVWRTRPTIGWKLIAAIEGAAGLKRASQVTMLTTPSMSAGNHRVPSEVRPRLASLHWKASGESGFVEELEELAGCHEVTWIHVRGHSGNRITNGVTRWR